MPEEHDFGLGLNFCDPKIVRITGQFGSGIFYASTVIFPAPNNWYVYRSSTARTLLYTSRNDIEIGFIIDSMKIDGRVWMSHFGLRTSVNLVSNDRITLSTIKNHYIEQERRIVEVELERLNRSLRKVKLPTAPVNWVKDGF